MHMIRKGQIEGIEKGNVIVQKQFVTGLFSPTLILLLKFE